MKLFPFTHINYINTENLDNTIRKKQKEKQQSDSSNLCSFWGKSFQSLHMNRCQNFVQLQLCINITTNNMRLS